ncbi:hypothetical protein B0I32_126160 [Nonomuraea fuscirosea]|uniref:Uncharacterized protein n=1 Tax=Nonomuraea fuscirosea TaxID=1291556 RepID=A0A2T0MDV5_9ACTN|nr:hypothetical protein [Nonomuraea fuscirosea]PRX55698.1 hypothetical protein B0I32_126160 [Nonomuraea fuscirosea]
MSTLSNVINIITMIVMVLLLLGGAILMATRRAEHGRGSVLGMIGCVVLLVGVVINGVYILMAPELVRSLGFAQYGPIALVMTLVSLLIQVSGTGLLIFAVIARRNPPQQAAQHAQQGWQQQPEWQQGYQQGPQHGYPQAPPQQPGWQPQQRPPFGEGQPPAHG